MLIQVFVYYSSQYKSLTCELAFTKFQLLVCKSYLKRVVVKKGSVRVRKFVGSAKKLFTK